jgi:arsenite methyltransferase
MAIACPVDPDTLKLRAQIQSIYTRLATEPSGTFHFHRGPTYAAEMLGYDANALGTLPANTTASFAGVANPHAWRRCPPALLLSTLGAAPVWICSLLLGR